MTETTMKRAIDLAADLRMIAQWQRDAVDRNRCLGAAEEIDRLDRLINSPHAGEFLEAVRVEAAHQVERWGVEHDAGKTDADWLWLIGWLAGKALHNPPKEGADAADLKRHRIVTVAAAALNWHAQACGTSNRMRPGIAAPPEETAA